MVLLLFCLETENEVELDYLLKIAESDPVPAMRCVRMYVRMCVHVWLSDGPSSTNDFLQDCCSAKLECKSSLHKEEGIYPEHSNSCGEAVEGHVREQCGLYG